ncbi:MAG: hypothetical protein A3G75_13235 [Verrucomicrobia bacterium RIFCSPLOWO2_12_FULL_64_8]|nr:MAG: hypothetical protein A3G75_13235 [Verrucomicrobia bacterium RIFCSPLOWO2_12_FULL_64_8]
MHKNLFATARLAFFSGIALLAPLVVTVWIFLKILDLVGGTFRPIFFFFVPETLRDHEALSIGWNILATVIVVALITGLGFLSRYVFGRFFRELAERFIQNIPGVGAIYGTVKQVVETFSTQNRSLFSKVVLVEFPRAGVYSLGFLTSKTQGEPQIRTGREVWTVFVPTTPNPTSGYLVLLPRSEIHELEMSVGDGMKMVISGGTVVPPWPSEAARVEVQNPALMPAAAAAKPEN